MDIQLDSIIASSDRLTFQFMHMYALPLIPYDWPDYWARLCKSWSYIKMVFTAYNVLHSLRLFKVKKSLM